MSILDRSIISYLIRHFKFVDRALEDYDHEELIGKSFSEVFKGIQGDMAAHIRPIEAFVTSFIDVNFDELEHTDGKIIETRMNDYIKLVTTKKKVSFQREWMKLNQALDSFMFTHIEKFDLLLGTQGYSISQANLRSMKNWHLHDKEEEGSSYRLTFFIRDKLLKIFQTGHERTIETKIVDIDFLNAAEILYLLDFKTIHNYIGMISINNKGMIRNLVTLRKIFPNLMIHHDLSNKPCWADDYHGITFLYKFFGDSKQIHLSYFDNDFVYSFTKRHTYTANDFISMINHDAIKHAQMKYIAARVPDMKSLSPPEDFFDFPTYYISPVWIYYTHITPEFRGIVDPISSYRYYSICDYAISVIKDVCEIKNEDMSDKFGENYPTRSDELTVILPANGRGFIDYIFSASQIEGISPNLCPYILSSYFIRTREALVNSAVFFLKNVSTLFNIIAKNSSSINLDEELFSSLCNISVIHVNRHLEWRMSEFDIGEFEIPDYTKYDHPLDISNDKLTEINDSHIIDIMNDYRTALTTGKMSIFSIISNHFNQNIEREMIINSLRLSPNSDISREYDLLRQSIGKVRISDNGLRKLIDKPHLFHLIDPLKFSLKDHSEGIDLPTDKLILLPPYLFHRVICANIRAAGNCINSRKSVEYLSKVLREITGEPKIPKGFLKLFQAGGISSRVMLAAVKTRAKGIKLGLIPSHISDFFYQATHDRCIEFYDEINNIENDLDAGKTPTYYETDDLYRAISYRPITSFFYSIMYENERFTPPIINSET